MDGPVATSGVNGPAAYGSDDQHVFQQAAPAVGTEATKPRRRAKRRSSETEGHNPTPRTGAPGATSGTGDPGTGGSATTFGTGDPGTGGLAATSSTDDLTPAAPIKAWSPSTTAGAWSSALADQPHPSTSYKDRAAAAATSFFGDASSHNPGEASSTHPFFANTPAAPSTGSSDGEPALPGRSPVDAVASDAGSSGGDAASGGSDSAGRSPGTSAVMPMPSGGLREVSQEGSAGASVGEPREIPSSRPPEGLLDGTPGMALSGPHDATTDSLEPSALGGAGSADGAQELESRSSASDATDVLNVPIGGSPDAPTSGPSNLPTGDSSDVGGFQGQAADGGVPLEEGSADYSGDEVHGTAESAAGDAPADQEVHVQSVPAQSVPAQGETAQDVTAQGETGQDVTAQGVTPHGVTAQGVTTESVAGDGGTADDVATEGVAGGGGTTEGGAAGGVVGESLGRASGYRRGEGASADSSSALDWGGSLLDGGAEDGQRSGGRKGRRGGRRTGGKGRRSSGRSWLPDGPDEESPDASAPPADPESVARAIVLRLLTMAPKTRAQLSEALRKRDVPEAAADAVLDRFSELGLINDEAFAEAWVDSRHHGRGLAKRALAAELRHRGVDNDTVKEAVERLDSDQEAETARRLVDRKLASTRSLDSQTRTRRLAGMLARKGYSSGLAYRVIREALDEEGIELEGDGFP
ncbi:RecX family transcriptional regulator [Nonomuraea wenchangensis]|uniref:RecX family transcriptional regulator n=1 Tax=Nonomuraea wenchangensis TaxID=568860 RepID=UPI00371FCDA6